jgi:hypothetical protein
VRRARGHQVLHNLFAILLFNKPAVNSMGVLTLS